MRVTIVLALVLMMSAMAVAARCPRDCKRLFVEQMKARAASSTRTALRTCATGSASVRGAIYTRSLPTSSQGLSGLGAPPRRARAPAAAWPCRTRMPTWA